MDKPRICSKSYALIQREIEELSRFLEQHPEEDRNQAASRWIATFEDELIDLFIREWEQS